MPTRPARGLRRPAPARVRVLVRCPGNDQTEAVALVEELEEELDEPLSLDLLPDEEDDESFALALSDLAEPDLASARESVR